MKSELEQDYAPLLDENGAYDGDVQKSYHDSNSKVKVGLVFALFISCALNVFLLAKSVWRNSSFDLSQQLYSPAMSEIEYRVQKFSLGFGRKDVPVYEQPPSPEVDEAWTDLYANYISTRIFRDEAAQSVNETARIWRSEGYMVALDVFHQLHCLDMIRKALHPHDYPDLELPPGHMRHCIGVLRQGTMCASDITPDVWQWSDKVNRVASRTDVLHTCRNFERIQKWASKRVISKDDWLKEDFNVKFIDDLEVKGYP